ncbi:unnamed protein product [Rotaria sp. Silwood2]|nr:unnamed protein product [Rotaria sp. Silwood2]CAF3941467.1 unnamed protein product [Rotaria sp. Silwood2]CAF4426439.1 unnamed protein product [Rotaria sp. Silwood2]
MLKFLKECGLRSYIPIDTCKQIMESIQVNDKQEGWTDEQHYKFLERYRMHIEHDDLLQLHDQYMNSNQITTTEHLRYT